KTWPELEEAAEQRFWDGFVLAAGSEPRPTGAIYVLGYVAELVLLVMWCRIIDADPAREVDFIATSPTEDTARITNRIAADERSTTTNWASGISLSNDSLWPPGW